MSTFDLPADVFADFPLLDMSALDHLLELPVLDSLDLGIGYFRALDILVDLSIPGIL